MIKLNLNLDRQSTPIINNNIFNKDLNFYVCSSGGCGSTIIFNYLSNFGNVHHIHDRYPPSKLCYTGSLNTNDPVYNEWFNKTEIPEEKLSNYRVIFVYRNPIDVIFSRFALPKGPNITHMQHVKCDNNGEIYFGDIIKSRRDLYKLEDFFDNYTIPKERNYPIYCVKYENFFTNIEIFNKILGIPNIKSLYPTKFERKKQYTYLKELTFTYISLINKMKRMRFIEIIPIKKVISNDGDDV
jgi:transposase-like protein